MDGWIVGYRNTHAAPWPCTPAPSPRAAAAAAATAAPEEEKGVEVERNLGHFSLVLRAAGDTDF